MWHTHGMMPINRWGQYIQFNQGVRERSDTGGRQSLSEMARGVVLCLLVLQVFACGVTQHNVIANKALTWLTAWGNQTEHTQQFAALLHANLDAFQNGAAFPDWGYVSSSLLFGNSLLTSPLAIHVERVMPRSRRIGCVFVTRTPVTVSLTSSFPLKPPFTLVYVQYLHNQCGLDMLSYDAHCQKVREHSLIEARLVSELVLMRGDGMHSWFPSCLVWFLIR